jgi:hypothetical protein
VHKNILRRRLGVLENLYRGNLYLTDFNGGASLEKGSPSSRGNFGEYRLQHHVKGGKS